MSRFLLLAVLAWTLSDFREHFAATMFSGTQLMLPSAGQVEKVVYRDIPVEKVVEVEKVGTDPDSVVPCL